MAVEGHAALEWHGHETRQLDDVALLEHWIAGDKEAGAQLIKRHSESLYSFFELRVPSEGADLTAATLLACIEGLAQLRDRHSFRSYLFGIARHILHQHYRKAGVRRRKQQHLNTTSMFDRRTSPSAAYDRRSTDTNLMRALATLPVDARMLLELAYWQDISGPELAEIFGVPENTIYTRLYRAKERLRESLGVVARRDV
jgi:RNA polymerase sigma-70 factor (ECF subfamily)